MRQAVSISALAKSAGVTAKTLRFWERIGLLPRAGRTHTGYRIFTPEVIHYIDFILKARSVGLTLAEMKRVVMLAQDGTNPCPEIVHWLDGKDKAIEQQIHSLRTLQPATKVAAVSSLMLNQRRGDMQEGKGTVLPNRRIAKLTINEGRMR